jgi:hypothetical protein
MGVGSQRHTPAALPSGKRTENRYTGDWSGAQNLQNPPGFHPYTVHFRVL